MVYYLKWSIRRGPGYMYNSVRMASKGEVKLATWMDEWKIPWEYEAESFNYILPPRKYTPDFKITCSDGTFFFVEYKGWLRPEDRTKMKAFKQANPSVDVRFVFANANKAILKGSKTTYGAWADKLGFPWAENEIPDVWLEGGAIQ